MVKQNYKLSEVGIIPNDWEVSIIGDFTDVFSGGTPNTCIPAFWGGDIPWMTSGEINLKYIYNVQGRITEEGLASSSTHRIPNYCVLIALAGQGKTRGTAAINLIPLCTNQSIAAIYPSKNHDSFFLYYLMSSMYDQLRALSSGGDTRGGLTKGLIKSISIPLPKLKEQQKIAEALRDTDSAIAALEKLIEKKKAIKQGAMQELLCVRNSNWIKTRITDIGYFYNGLSGKTKQNFGTGNGRYITFLNVLSNVVIDVENLGKVDVNEYEKQNQVAKNDIFFNTSSETPEEVGMCATLDRELKNTYLNSFCFGMRLYRQDIYHSLFLSYYFNSPVGREIMLLLAQGSTRFNLSKSAFAETEVYLPEYNKQILIANILSSIDSDIELLKAKKQKLCKIKQGMMENLLTGKIRLA